MDSGAAQLPCRIRKEDGSLYRRRNIIDHVIDPRLRELSEL